jgi:tetratricopeptide (TPR) repeat protein
VGDSDELHAGDAELCAGGGADRLAAEGETALARLLMDGGDLPHAAVHLGNSFAADPRLPEAHEALAELATRAGGPHQALELFPVERPFIGAMVCRAHLQAARGAWADAVGLIAGAIRAEYDRPWSHVAWLTQDALPDLLPPQAMTQALARAVGGSLPDPLPEASREALRPFYDLARAVVARHPDDARLAAIGSGLARRIGDTDRAVAWAEQARRIQPGHIPSVMLGYALRAAGRADDALQVWQQEIARDASDLSLMVDVAELCAATGRARQGLPWAERAAAADPDHPQAAPAVFGVRYAADGDPAHLLGLTDHLREHPDHPYAATVLARHSEWQPWLGMVAGTTEATVNVLHQILESPDAEAARGHEIELAASMIEPPSATLAFLMSFPNGEIANQSVGDPDPREPAAPVGRVVWRYEGLTAHPAVPEPAPAAADLVRDTAAATWPHLPAAYDHAVRLSGLALEDLLGVLVHPPLPAADEQGRYLRAHRPELWIRAVQTFACLGLAHHRADEPWRESVRRSVLLDLLGGPEDWVNEAAAFAMVATAWVDPSVREDVGLRVVERMLAAAKAYQTREVTVLGSLCRLVLLCPWLDESYTGLARDLLDAVHRADEREPADARERGRKTADAAKAASDARQDPPADSRAREPRRAPRRGLFRRRRD